MSTSDEIVPQVVSGGGWQTTFTFVSAEDAAVSFPITFRTADGQPWRVPMQGQTATDRAVVMLPPRGTVTLATSDAGPLTQGWAQLDLPCCPDVGGYAVFKQSVPGRPDFEAVVPFGRTFNARSLMMFDNTAGYATGIAIVSTSSFIDATVTVAIRDEAGNRIALDQFRLNRLNKQVFVLAERWPEAAGRKGSIEFSSSPGQISVLGLRFNSGGAFTSVHSLEP